MADTTETLANCPFCGGDTGALLGESGWRVWCLRPEKVCGMIGPFKDTEADAIATWNRRTSDGWLPIGDAPKDGTQVLLVDDAPTPEAVIGYWDENTDWRHVPGEWPLSPTHWQPLPAPPVRALAERKAG